MIIIGLVLVAAAAVFGADLIWKSHYTIRGPALFGQTLGIHTATRHRKETRSSGAGSITTTPTPRPQARPLPTRRRGSPGTNTVRKAASH